MKHFPIMIGGSLCAFVCGCPPEDNYAPVPYEEVDKVVVLVVDDTTNKFEGGGYYFYDKLYPSFNLKVENIPANDVGYITVHFEEPNDLVYYATQILNGKGDFIIPKPFYDATYFDVLDQEDFLSFPVDAIELTNLGNNGNVEEKWAAIQNLRVVRTGKEIKNNKVYYFKQNLDGVEGKNTKWIFITKY